MFFPLWAQEFGLSLTQIGFLKTVFSGALSSFQLPTGFLAEKLGERAVLTGGTVLTAVAFASLGVVNGFYAIIFCLFLIGLGSATQHPLSSALVSQAYANGARRAALGTYNFTGDLGKVAVPALVAVGVATVGWRGSAIAYGLLSVLAAVGIFLLLRAIGAGDAPRIGRGQSVKPTQQGWGIRYRRGFQILSAIAVVDFSTRAAFLTFLPFLLIGKGTQPESVGFALALVFGGGAAGKVLCGLGAARFGIVRTAVFTELVTGGGILLLLNLPLSAALAFLPVVGFALNGTSSVLYGTVAEFTAPERQSRAFGLFYTIGVGASAVAPLAYGIVSDLTGVTTTMTILGLVVLSTIPMCYLLTLSLAAAREESA